MEKAACGLCFGLAVLVLATAPAMADVVVIRGASTEVVSASAGNGGSVAVLRGTPGKDTAPSPARHEASREPVARGVQGTGENLWTIDSRGRVRACWLTGTGYVNSLKVVCTR